MSDERYADTIGEVTLTGAVVRIDLASLSPTERDEKNQPKMVIRERIVMPVDGFVRSFALMAQVMQQLEKQGVIRRQTGEAAPVAAPAEPPKSKNFK
jgi:hypothetical protein